MIISIANNKGGVGKTTISKILTEFLSSKKYKTLIIDLDSQGHVKTLFNIENKYNWLEYFKSDKKVEDITFKYNDYLDILTTDQSLIDFKSTEEGKGLFLKKLILENNLDEKYDFIFIDCPPQIEWETSNALIISDKVIIPAIPEQLSIDASIKMINFIKKIQSINTNLSLDGIIFNQVSNLKIHKNNINKINDILSDKVYKTKIRYNTSIKENQQSNSSLLSLRGYIGNYDINKFTKEFLERNLKG